MFELLSCHCLVCIKILFMFVSLYRNYSKTSYMSNHSKCSLWMFMYEKPSYSTWVDESVVFSKHLDFLNLLLASKLEFVVNGSFYPMKSHLISAAWFASTERQLVAKAIFITLVVEEF